MEAAKLYDEEHKRCNEDCQRARDHAEAAANFLWLISAGAGKITPLKFAVRPNDEELQQYFSNRALSKRNRKLGNTKAKATEC